MSDEIPTNTICAEIIRTGIERRKRKCRPVRSDGARIETIETIGTELHRMKKVKMTSERIQELKNISNRRGMFTESTICDCLDECVDEIERCAEDRYLLEAEVARLKSAYDARTRRELTRLRTIVDNNKTSHATRRGRPTQ